MSTVIDKTDLFKGISFKNDINKMFCRLEAIKEEELQKIRDNPEQFIEDTRPYVEGLRELTDEMRNTGITAQLRPTDTLPSTMPRSTINVPMQDYERWKRMESTVERLKARLGLQP